MDEVNEDTYLGDIVINNWSNLKNIIITILTNSDILYNLKNLKAR